MERRSVIVDTAILAWPPKNPGDVANYEVNWKLGDDRIVTSKWDVPFGIDGSRASHDSEKTWIWLAGGNLGSRYTLRNSITTAFGRVLSRMVHIKIKHK